MRFDASFPLFSHIVNRGLFVLIFSHLPLILMSQSWPGVYWLNESTATIRSIEADSTLREWNGEFWEVRDTLAFTGIEVSDFEGITNLHALGSGTPLLFIGPGTQQVYRYSEAKQTFERLDATYHRGYNFNAIQWVRNDTLYSLGGYGFWHTQGVLSYFNRDSKEWHVIPTQGGPEHITAGYHQWSMDGRYLYFTYAGEVHGSDVTHDPRVWRLDTKTFTWSELGELNNASLLAIREAKAHLNLPIGTILSNGQNRLLDLESNRLDFLDPSVIDIRYQQATGFESGNGTLIGGEYFLNLRVSSSSSSGKSIGFKYPYDKILNARRNPEKVYQAGWSYWILGAIGLGGVLLLWLMFRLFKKIKQPFLKGTTVQAEELFFNTLEKQEVVLLKALLRAEMRGEGLKSGPITEIMGWTDKSWDNQRKWRNNLIKELNNRAEENLNIQELILRERDALDKRERVYRLNGDGFRLLRDSIHFS